jgi:hypothetical protein
MFPNKIDESEMGVYTGDSVALVSWPANLRTKHMMMVTGTLARKALSNHPDAANCGQFDAAAEGGSLAFHVRAVNGTQCCWNSEFE